MFFQIAKNLLYNWATFVRKFVTMNFKKITQSGHTELVSIEYQCVDFFSAQQALQANTIFLANILIPEPNA